MDDITELSDVVDFSFDDLSITLKNYHLPVQGVSVEYLPENQKLQIPAALGMSWSPTNTKLCSETEHTLYSRFWKVASMSYIGVKSLLNTTNSASTIREVIDGLEMMTPVTERPTTRWETMEEDSDETFGNLSKILEFNCDIRDFGYLLTENATVNDTAWLSDVENITRVRLENKLKPYTMRMIAALNYGSVGNYPLGGWIRAYGLGVGIYPARGSAFKVEAVYTTKMPSTDAETAVLAFEQSYGKNLMNLSLNILAVFGLLHLSKDKTFVRGDEYMNRIGNSYLETLKNPDMANLMMTNHKECLLRIAPHPFGLAQTYWLAKVMYKHQLLMPLLASRFHHATPPRVQRLMVILEAAREWEDLSSGREVLKLFSNQLARLKAQEAAIKKAPPRYSDLYRFYGCEEKMEIQGNDVKTLMPATYGYVMVAHVSEDGKKKNGIALARCLKSVERDMKGLGNYWKKLWRSKLQSSSN